MGDFRIAQKRRTRNGMGSSSTNNQAEHQSSKVLRYGSLKSMKRSFTISVDQPRCFTLQLSGLEHCLSPASSQGRRRVPAGDLQGSSQRRCTHSGAANADLADHFNGLTAKKVKILMDPAQTTPDGKDLSWAKTLC